MSALLRTTRAAREEWNGAQPRVILATLTSGLVPDLVGNRVRVAMIRWAGVSIGLGTVIGGGMRIVGAGRGQDRLGIGAIVSAGATVTTDVVANTLVGGAQLIRVPDQPRSGDQP